MIYISCSFWTPIGRHDVYDYVRGLELSVFAQEAENILLGQYHAELLMLSQAQLDGENLLDIFDAHSGDMEYLYESLFERDEEFQKELELHNVTDHLLCLWDSVLHPKLQLYEQGILETIGTLFGHETVLALHRDATSLSEKDLAEVGFAKIAETEFIYRHMALLTGFSKANPQGVEVPLEFTANAEDEQWVKSRLKRSEPDV